MPCLLHLQDAPSTFKKLRVLAVLEPAVQVYQGHFEGSEVEHRDWVLEAPQWVAQALESDSGVGHSIRTSVASALRKVRHWRPFQC